jgi:hypothetical protein
MEDKNERNYHLHTDGEVALIKEESALLDLLRGFWRIARSNA